MDEKYSRAVAAGLLVGLLLICGNVWANLLYQKDMNDYLASETSRYVDNLCVGIDTYFYLTVISAIAYAASGVFFVWHARRYLNRRLDAARVALLAAAVVGLLSAFVTGPVIEGLRLIAAAGLLPAGLTPMGLGGWPVIYMIYVLPGLLLAILAGSLYYDSLASRVK